MRFSPDRKLFSDDLITRAQAIFGEQAGRPVTREDADLCLSRLVTYYPLLLLLLLLQAHHRGP